MRKIVFGVCAVLAAVSSEAQNEGKAQARDAVAKAEARLEAAAVAGARNYASEIYDEAVFRLQYAREHLDSRDKGESALAMQRAVQAWRAAEAAEAKAKWLSVVTELRSLQAEIVRLGGEAPRIEFGDANDSIDRGATSMQKVEAARRALERARAAGAGPLVAGDLEKAEGYLETATTVARANPQSRSAEHLAYVSEMIARRAWYLHQLVSLTPRVPELRERRVDLVQREMDLRAERERVDREAAERRAAELRRQLEQERQRREAEQEEVERLRLQLRQQQEYMVSQLSRDRRARLEAERQLDLLRAEYEEALMSQEIDAQEVENLRQRLEDQRLELGRLQGEEMRSEETLLSELRELREELRRERQQGRVPSQILLEREAFIDRQADELEELRREREQRLAERRQLERAFKERVEIAERNLKEVELESERLQEQMAEERARAEAAEQELQRLREEMARREAEAEAREQERAEKMAAMEAQLAQLADTRREERGFIVTLPGLFFDTGKATLKPGTRSNLAKIAEQVASIPDLVIVVEGHTDSVGSEELNQRLSEQRAMAVRDYLVSQGVSPLVITTLGRGESQPVASNDTAEGRSKNRRVDLIITMRE